MKVVKVLLYVLLAFVVIGAILGMIGPKTYKVERSVVIAATPNRVWPHMSSLRKANEWSPFLKMDKAAVVTYSGKDGEVGSSSSWSGNHKVGKGSQTITSIEPMKSSEVQLKFFMPWGEMVSSGSLHLDPDPAGTKVTWVMEGKNNYVGRMMGSVMSMDKNVGPSFESGLADLKKMVESSPGASSVGMNYQINPTPFAGGKYLAIHKTMPMSDISDAFMKGIPNLMTEVKKAKKDVAGAPVGIYYTWDEKKMEADIAVAVPFKGDMKAPAGMEIITVPASKAMVIEYNGGYGKMGDAHMAMADYIQTSKLENVLPVMEEYVVGPAAEKDSTKWMTRIIYLVK